ncbi:MAG: SDR family oxidoreductase [Bacteroidales bacterium]|nr:SDR family oxidoreductase [Bacteroidales bacterium]MBP5614531.1 SDR family oxidoreductase [Bacteroidales bacterium]
MKLKYTFKDKTAIVTGASSGIGKALAYSLAEKGANVMLAARREERLRTIVEEIVRKGGSAAYCVTDVTDETDCQRMVEETVRRWKCVDIMICNAGISMRANFDDVQISVIRRLMDVNFFGTVNCTKYALPYLQKSKGTLVGVSSTAGIHGLPWRTGYSASKFAITGFLETIRLENLKKGVHVMIAYPGFTSSEIRYHALTADGSSQGNTPRNESEMTSSEEAAARILKGIRLRTQYQVTFTDLVVYFAKFLHKRLLNRVVYNMMAKEPDAPTNEQ